MFYQTQTARRPRKGPKKCRFLSLVTLTLKLVQVRDQTHLPCEFGANPFSGSQDISYAKKNHRLMAPKTEPAAVHCIR